ncbi:MAG: DUF5677 domain-containing protein [Roseovarius sp.]|jgi:hypothetical protein|nr:DUF5677 domain-containing protein [Roseovarius sp.]
MICGGVLERMSEKQPRSLEQASEILETLAVQLQQLTGEQPSVERAFEVSLLCALYQMGRGIVVLEHSRQTFEALVILRSMLEHFVELKLLQQYPKRHLNHKLGLDKQTRLQLREAVRNNPYSAGTSDIIDIDGELHSVEERMADYKAKGARETTVTADWKAADLSDEYETVYRNLSSYVHPSLAGSLNRNLGINESGKFVADLATAITPDTSAVVSDPLCGVLLVAQDVSSEMLGT